jgi:hypothetical protein
LGVFASGLAYVAYFWLVNNAGSIRASLVTYIVPVVGLLLGWVVLGETLEAATVVGTGLIILGVASLMRGPAPASQETGRLLPRLTGKPYGVRDQVPHDPHGVAPGKLLRRKVISGEVVGES